MSEGSSRGRTKLTVAAAAALMCMVGAIALPAPAGATVNTTVFDPAGNTLQCTDRTLTVRAGSSEQLTFITAKNTLSVTKIKLINVSAEDQYGQIYYAVGSGRILETNTRANGTSSVVFRFVLFGETDRLTVNQTMRIGPTGQVTDSNIGDCTVSIT